MGIFKEVSNSLRKRLDPDLRRMVRLGYLNESLQRTHDGIHIILNFVEAHLGKEFNTFLKESEKEKIAEAKENGDCAK